MRFVVTLLSAAAFTAPASAGLLTTKATGPDNIYLKCDGYSPPGKKADNLTTSSLFWGLSSTTSDQRRSTTTLGADGAQACDAALADPLLLPNFAMRRANLLQAKAIHQIADGKFADALQSLSRSDEAGRVEPLFDQSIGQGNRALTAVALNGLGRKDEANSVLDSMEAKRPWAASQRQFATNVRLQFEDDRQHQIAVLEKVAPVLPDATKQLFWIALRYEDWNAAVNYARGVSFEDAQDHGGWTGSMDFIEPHLDTLDRARFAGALAYAQFAAGQKESAASTMAAAKARIDATMAPLPPLEKGRSYKKKDLAAHEQRKSFGALALKLLDGWAAAINLRADAPTLTLEEIQKRIEDGKQKVPTIGDIVAHAKLPDLEASQKQHAILTSIAADRDAERLKAMKMTFQQLVKMLPRPETPSMSIVYKREGNYFFGNMLAGYAVNRGSPAGANTVRFSSDRGSLAAVDEGALYAAAQFAQGEGKDSFLIDAREPIERTIRYTGMYSGGRIAPSGYEVRLVIRPINGAEATPADRPRLIPVSTVNSALAAKLTPPTR